MEQQNKNKGKMKTKISKKDWSMLIAITAILAVVIFSGCIGEEKQPDEQPKETEKDYKIVTDMWDRKVKIPNDPKRVVVDDFTGTYLKIMKTWKIDDKIVAVDDSQKKNPFLRIICPRLEEITDVGSYWKGYNYESIAASNPDVIILRAFADTSERKAGYKEFLDRMEKMNITVIVLLHPTSFKEPNVDTMWQEIRILGEIFDKEKNADELIDNLNSRIRLVKERTKDIPEDKRPKVLMFATVDYVLGKQTIQSYFLEEIVHAKNIGGNGSWSKISPEQILALNPDVMIVMAHAGYVSPEDVYAGVDTGFNWKLVQEADVIKERRVGSLGNPEWRCETLEGIIGTLRMAKIIYPEKFEDIDPDKEEIKLYKEFYGFTDEEVERAVRAQRAKLKDH